MYKNFARKKKQNEKNRKIKNYSKDTQKIEVKMNENDEINI